MTIDNRSISLSKKLPYTFFFEGLVRQCLLNFLKNNPNRRGKVEESKKSGAHTLAELNFLQANFRYTIRIEISK